MTGLDQSTPLGYYGTVALNLVKRHPLFAAAAVGGVVLLIVVLKKSFKR